MKICLSLVLVFIATGLCAQKTFLFIVKDSITGEALPGVTIKSPGISKSTNERGEARFENLAEGAELRFSSVGYQEKQVVITGLQAETTIVYLLQAHKTEEEIIVSSSRTESRIENLPTKVEVLGTEEVEEESGIKPAQMASLLGDLAGIQAQQTSPVTGNTELRIQGLPGKYTQLLRDGMPLFGDFAGGFSIMQIPPLDLKQVEIIKGASSTLYGGGAIAGMINMVSRKPKLNGPERSVLLNYTSLKELNANLYLSNRNTHHGYTFFAGANDQRAVDVNKDGYSDVAKSHSFFIHPAVFFYPSAKTTIATGLNLTGEERTGGDMQVLKGKTDAAHAFFIGNKTFRTTADIQVEYRKSPIRIAQIKSIASWFSQSVHTNSWAGAGFRPRQLSWFSEASYLWKSKRNDFVAGINLNCEKISERSALPAFPALSWFTAGVFVQDDWRLHPRFTLETGLRNDYNNEFGNFLLPRVSLLYKLSPAISSRIGGGMGYRLPSLYESDVDERDYFRLGRPAKKAESSYGGNFDVNFHQRVSNEMELTINQSFFITYITRPVTVLDNGTEILFENMDSGLHTKGFETYVQINADELEIYLGYVFTDASRKYDPVHPHMPLIARHKFASVLSYEFSDSFRAGVEAAVTGKQYLDDGSQTRPYVFGAAMMRYDISHFAFVLNCENLFDFRQGKNESLIASGPPTNPVFKELWAPIDGRVINLSVRIRF